MPVAKNAINHNRVTGIGDAPQDMILLVGAQGLEPWTRRLRVV
jgi:hypothetical protein